MVSVVPSVNGKFDGPQRFACGPNGRKGPVATLFKGRYLRKAAFLVGRFTSHPSVQTWRRRDAADRPHVSVARHKPRISPVQTPR